VVERSEADILETIKKNPGKRILISSWHFQFPTKDPGLLEDDPKRKEIFEFLKAASVSVEQIHTDSHQTIWAVTASKN
jgi:hypothetical protein